VQACSRVTLKEAEELSYYELFIEDCNILFSGLWFQACVFLHSFYLFFSPVCIVCSKFLASLDLITFIAS